MQDVKCTFATNPNSQLYECTVDSSAVINCQVKFIGHHSPGKSNRDVDSLHFNQVFFSQFPRNVHESFANLTRLWVAKSTLEAIHREDVCRLANLRQFCVANCNLRKLNGDIFSDLKRLEVISLKGNQLEEIGPEILDGLDCLKWVNLTENPSIDILYSKNIEWPSLEDVKREIKVKCMPKQLHDDREARIKLLEEQNQKLSAEVSDFRRIFDGSDFKDFTIVVGTSSFKVHKLLIAARSPVLAKILRNNTDAHELTLQDTSESTFRVIYDFIYTRRLSMASKDLIGVFTAAAKLQIDDLKEAIAAQLLESVSEGNALEVLTLANKFQHEQLKRKAFYVVRTDVFPDQLIDEGLAGEPEKLRAMIEARVAGQSDLNCSKCLST